MKTFPNGYQYPVMDQNICVDCGICAKSCPVLHVPQKHEPMAVFSATYKSDDRALLKSSSGGIAYALSKYVLDQGGVVFGAAYDEHMSVKHVCVSKMDDLHKLQGSKYVQSDTGTTYSEVKKYLAENRTVLYFGVPCQIGGLLSYLKGKEYPNLITCDLFCAGTPSPGVFQKYIEYLESKFGSKVEHFNFRCKKYGYGYLSQLQLSNGKSRILYGKDAYYVQSGGAGYNRKSCLDCEYASLERIGDLTIGDFKQLKVDAEKKKKGVSMILVNTLRGEEILSRIQNELIMQERNMDDVRRSQGCSISKKNRKPQDYDDYFADYQKMGWGEFSKKYLASKSMKHRIIANLHPAIVFQIKKVLGKY